MPLRLTFPHVPTLVIALTWSLLAYGADQDPAPVLPPAPVPPRPSLPITPALAETLAAVTSALDEAGVPDARGSTLVIGEVELTRSPTPGSSAPASATCKGPWLHLRRPDGTLLVGGLRPVAANVTIVGDLDSTWKPNDHMKFIPETATLRWIVLPQDQLLHDALIPDFLATIDTPMEALFWDSRNLLIPWLAQTDRAAAKTRLMMAWWNSELGVLLNPRPHFDQYPDEIENEIIGSGGLPAAPWVPPEVMVRRYALQVLVDLARRADGDGYYVPLDRARVLTAARRLAGADPAEKERIAGIARSLAVPARVPPTADLAARVAAWQPATPWLKDLMGDGDVRWSAEELSDPPGQDSPDALVALLADPQPARWIDRGWPRTLGDSAFNALGRLVGCDLRLAVGRDIAAPWTAEERMRTVEAVQAWWAAHRGSSLTQIRQDLVRRLPASTLVGWLQGHGGRDPDEVVGTLAAAWGTPVPALSNQDLRSLLLWSHQDERLRRTVLAWPIAGSCRRELLALHAAQGDRVPLDVFIRAGLTQDSTGPMAEVSYQEVVPAVYELGTASQVKELRSMVTAPWTTPADRIRWQALVVALASQVDFPTDAEERNRHAFVVSLLLLASLLEDARPVPQDMALGVLNEVQRRTGWSSTFLVQGDERVADLAGALLPRLAWTTGELAVVTEVGDTDDDVRAWRRGLQGPLPRPVRDRRLRDFRRSLVDAMEGKMTDTLEDLPLPRRPADEPAEEPAPTGKATHF